MSQEPPNRETRPPRPPGWQRILFVLPFATAWVILWASYNDYGVVKTLISVVVGLLLASLLIAGMRLTSKTVVRGKVPDDN